MMIAGNPDMVPMTEEEHAAAAVGNLLPAAIAGLRELIAQDRAAAS
ncbi:hypothetical protein [Microbacterium esteraromaticum]|nr:hypothetical protein [Microbacterium esteraromaticum]